MMVIDEFYFHHKRGLGKWESIGHPIDTFFYLLCFIPCLYLKFQTNISLFIFLCLTSTLIITKDEWIHKDQSSGSENWLHALQFIIHPISLLILAVFWREDQLDFIKIQAFIVLLFLIYQVLYWNFFKKNRYVIKG